MSLKHSFIKPKAIFTALLVTSIYTNLAGCSATITPEQNELVFIKAQEDINLETLNRRKWDNPIVADFDQDGHTDLLLLDHGRLMKMYWNNGQGKFLKPIRIRGGDLHGVAVGDINQDGKLNIVVSQGGGAGTNLRKPEFYQIEKNRKISKLADLDKNFVAGRGRGAKLVDADKDGDLDLILPGAMSSKDKQSQIFVYENNGKGHYTLHSRLPTIRGEAQRLKITDFNNDGIFDLIFYGTSQPIKLYQGDGNLGYKNVTEQVLAGNQITHVLGIAEIDFDNDGDFDLFLNRSGEIDKQYLHYDAEKKNLAVAVRNSKKIDIKQIQAGDILKITNFQKVLKKRVYLGKTKTLLDLSKNDWHAGVDLSINHHDANGFPDHSDLEKDSIHIGYLGDGNWRLAALTQFLGTMTLVDVIINQIENKPIEQHSGILLENAQGKLLDISASSQLDQLINTTGTAVADYNNDGFNDLFVVKHGTLANPVKQALLINNGRGQFNLVTHHQIESAGMGTFGMGADSLDYNQDGLVDLIYTNERGLWHLYKNSMPISQKNNYIKFKVSNSPTGKATALGAIVTLYLDNGITQTQRVGYGAAPYSQSFNDTVHFGIGKQAQFVKMEVKWTNGESVVLNSISDNNNSISMLTN